MTVVASTCLEGHVGKVPSIWFMCQSDEALHGNSCLPGGRAPVALFLMKVIATRIICHWPQIFSGPVLMLKPLPELACTI